MKKLAIVFFIVLITAAAGSLTVSDRLAADDQGRIGENASSVRIIQAPTLESSTDTSAIVRWTAYGLKRATAFGTPNSRRDIRLACPI